ncbi:hypothetical protein AALP_AA8G341800, partial [Arabis alpina]
MSTSGEKTPSVPSTHVTLKVQMNQDEKCIYIRVKRDVGLHTMMEAFCIKVGGQMSHFIFCFDGDRINRNQTANELELEDGDEIDVFGHQMGGFSLCGRHY